MPNFSKEKLFETASWKSCIRPELISGGPSISLIDHAISDLYDGRCNTNVFFNFIPTLKQHEIDTEDI